MGLLTLLDLFPRPFASMFLKSPRRWSRALNHLLNSKMRNKFDVEFRSNLPKQTLRENMYRKEVPIGFVM